MSTAPENNQRRRRNRRRPAARGPPLRTRAGDYPPIATFFDAFSSWFTRDTSRTPEHDFRLLQELYGWEIGSDSYTKFRRKFLTALVAETRSPVHVFFVNHHHFLEYDSTASPHIELARLKSLSRRRVRIAAFSAALLAEFNGPLDSFFFRYPILQYNPRGAPMAEFRRLVSANGWDPERARHPEHNREPESQAYMTARAAFFDAFRDEFDYLFGGNAEDTMTWQSLCETLGIDAMPSSVTQCKKATRPLMVNIYDIVNHKRTGAPFDFFNSLADLSSYTFEFDLVFPLKKAKESALKFLLRPILRSGRRA
ncbi:hypothetical protein Q9L58_006542 [Maublancomyces gigas]|uniref:Uncharacterized protein n=1 Tax=Discina gigas TaxID=1032678 RepID=A0ABR3GFF3_9PEZI